MRKNMKEKTEVQSESEEQDQQFLPNGPKCYYRWTLEENKAYAQFLKNNIEVATGSEPRKREKFFSQMSIELKNGRDNCKCRSHHQKMMNKFKTIQKIIQHYLLAKEEEEQGLQKGQQAHSVNGKPGSSTMGNGKVETDGMDEQSQVKSVNIDAYLDL